MLGGTPGRSPDTRNHDGLLALLAWEVEAGVRDGDTLAINDDVAAALEVGITRQ